MSMNPENWLVLASWNTMSWLFELVNYLAYYGFVWAFTKMHYSTAKIEEKSNSVKCNNLFEFSISFPINSNDTKRL